MILTLSVYHTRESLNNVTDYLKENVSFIHHQKKEDTMEANQINSDNQTKQNYPVQTSTCGCHSL